MRVQPVRFIGHKIGPFEHIELNWPTDKDIRSTIIIGENGAGKTTLVTSMAACLGNGNLNAFPQKEFDRLAYDENSSAFFEFLLDGTLMSSLVITHHIQKEYMESRIPSFASGVFHFGPEINLDDSSIVSIRGSKSFKNFQDTWRANQDITVMAATYGPFRDLVDKPITGFEELAELPLQNILNPFRPPTESNISQWIANQHIRRALAIADDAQYEADVYLESIHRVERLITKSLGLPIKFRLERNPITLKAEQNGESISINQLSDGTRSFLSWTLDYLSRASRVNWKDPAQAAIAPGIILVDEIDSHLHPEWQRRVMADAMDLLPETHIIATTHSPFVVGSADDTQVFRIYKDEQNQFQVASHYDEFFGYPADLVLQKLFTDSLYTPKIQRELDRLSELAAKLAGGAITEDERQEHDHLLGKLANVSSWIANLLAMTRQTNNGVSR